MKTEINNPDGIILIEVPHQLHVKSYSFDSQDEFMAWLRKTAPCGFSWRKFTREEWQEEVNGWGDLDSPYMDAAKKRANQGFAMFDAGNPAIVEYCYGESHCELETEGAAPTEYGALLHACVHDNHGHYVLTHSIWLELKAGTFNMFPHQQIQARLAIEREAETLGWFKEYEDYTVKISTEPSYYGTDCTDEQAVEIVKSLSELIKSNFPGINTEQFRDGQTSSKTTGPKESVCDEINEWIADNWTAAI